MEVFLKELIQSENECSASEETEYGDIFILCDICVYGGTLEGDGTILYELRRCG